MAREPLVSANPPQLPLDNWLSEAPVSIAVAGRSMEPFLLDGDRVFVVRAPASGFVIGALIVFMRAKELVIHRLVALRPDKFLEMGDAQERGNWHFWPPDVGLVISVSRTTGMGLDLGAGFCRRAAFRRARRMRIRHVATVVSEVFPDGLLRRTFRRLVRPILLPPSPVSGFDAEEQDCPPG